MVGDGVTGDTNVGLGVTGIALGDGVTGGMLVLGDGVTGRGNVGLFSFFMF